ncbi:winged helix-turn-helix transcriptional regulator [Microlunatus elymi]|uniref:Winged helix-turn-helix transcriptional regulator n=1 Tax=Microlunatus elymi TaxID=2596828 RepID=A0A516PV75_9ACTN|nr:metalloregulator ArsR/SmtB family transcription factor [Microlunatus elymi]QDP95059.1 winged helix-turn-helix transcriptional regulator [Microlunatus elymi]
MTSSTLARTFEALSDERRCRVVELLGTAPRSAGELAQQTGLSASAMSRHLRVLLELELITDSRHPDDARVRMFSLRPERLADCRSWLDQVQAHWQQNLAAFKQHVEKSTPSKGKPDRRTSQGGRAS